jgi:hypothetical protein
VLSTADNEKKTLVKKNFSFIFDCNENDKTYKTGQKIIPAGRLRNVCVKHIPGPSKLEGPFF